MPHRPELPRTLFVLGGGELGKEIVIAAQRLGLKVIVAGEYANAPAMQVADVTLVFSLMDVEALEAAIRNHRPDYIIPEIEAVRADRLLELEEDGYPVIPTAEATVLTMGREAIRKVAAEELAIRTPEFAFAESADQLLDACDRIGYPCVVKSLMSASGRGQSVVSGPARVETAWEFACEDGFGDEPRVIVEEFIEFDTEITLLTVREWDGHTHFIRPIGHRQERGDFRESWMPANVPEDRLAEAQAIAQKITDRLGGAGIFGVEFFVTPDEVIFSEVSPRPHDTGMVTSISQDLSQFDLHLRAVLGLPIPAIRYAGPAASAAILSDVSGEVHGYDGLKRAMLVESAQVRLFGKPTARPFRRMGVALATGVDVEEARARALEAAARVEVQVR